MIHSFFQIGPEKTLETYKLLNQGYRDMAKGYKNKYWGVFHPPTFYQNGNLQGD